MPPCAVVCLTLTTLSLVVRLSAESVTLPENGAFREYVRGAPVAETQTGAPAVDQWVLYPAEAPQTDATRRLLRNRVAVQLEPDAIPALAARRHGLTDDGPAAGPAEDSGWRIWSASSPDALAGILTDLAGDREIREVSPLLYRLRFRRFAPNDTYFSAQWHLLNTGQGGGTAGIDVNVSSVWDSWKGTGQRIAIVDDGLQVTHPDLSPNVDLVNDHDWNDFPQDDDPSPDVTIDDHGTACAGVAAARGNNGTGVSGAAPEATLVGLRLIADYVSDDEEADALTWKNNIIQIFSNSWGPDDDGSTLEEPGPCTILALADAAATGRGGKGTIFTWAGGNGRAENDNSNYDGYANSIYTIAVGAVTNTGGIADYAEPGANLVVSAPSDGGTLGIATTDLTGTRGYNSNGSGGNLASNNYTNDFGGTSSATPLVAGCVALLLESNPALGWRDVQEILMRSATKNSPASAEWITNGAGLHFSHDFGAGLLNAQAAVTLATGWANLAPATTAVASESGLTIPIPDNPLAGISRTFDLTASNLRVEHVTVKVDILHSRRGHLEVTLTSPAGTVSKLAATHTDNNANYSNWTFSTVRNWGESSQGTWTLAVRDRTSATTGTYRAATLTVHGTPLGPVDHPPAVTAAALTPAGTAWSDTSLALTGVAASDEDGDAVTLTRRWEMSGDGVTWSAVPGASGVSLALTDSFSGNLLRCVLTPSANGLNGAEFPTAPVPVLRRPLQWARRGQVWSYDSDLFLATSSTPLTRDVVIHEFSQGPSGGTSEWVELLVVQQTDLRGWSLADAAGTYVTFSTAALWADVPAGTLIVIYRGTSRDPAVPVALDTDAADFRLVIPHDNTVYFTGNAWGGLSKSGSEAVVLRRADAAVADGVSFNGNSLYTPALGSVGSAKGAQFTGWDEAALEVSGGWTVGDQAQSTPGSTNGGEASADGVFVAALRSGSFFQQAEFRTGAATTLTGPGIDPASGLLSGVVTSADGSQRVVIERFLPGGDITRQDFLVYVYDPAAPGDLLRLALGNPSALPVPVFENGAVTVEFTVPGGLPLTGGPVYTLETSADLQTWTPSPAAPVIALDGQDLRTVKLSTPVSGSRVFARLRVTAPGG